MVASPVAKLAILQKTVLEEVEVEVAGRKDQVCTYFKVANNTVELP